MGGHVWAQSLSDTLSPVEIKSTHHKSGDERVNDFIPGQKITSFDSTLLQQYSMRSMAGLLDQQTSVFVKSYGFNGLATLTLRGASAAQSAVYWNGVPLAQGSLGVADISELPVFLAHRANLVLGGNSALWGSGNVGGALLLESDQPVHDTSGHRLDVSLGAGSFGQKFAGVHTALWNKKWFLSADLFSQYADNSFQYTDLLGSVKILSNSRLSGNALQLQLSRKLGQNQDVGIYAWLQEYDRQIPPALFEPVSLKTQKDEAVRLLADWKMKTRKGKVYFKASLNRDKLNYSDAVAGISEQPVSQQFYVEAGWEYAFNADSRFILFAPCQSQLMWQNAGAATHTQNRAALAAAYKQSFLKNRLQIALNGREEFIQDRQVFCPGEDAAFDVVQGFTVRGNIQRTYRIPSLNELYYWPGGNTSLRPEQGWSQSLGYHLTRKLGPMELSHDLDWFNRNIQDWIIWMGGAVWTPYNIASVHSRGLETDNAVSVRLKSWLFRVDLSTSYVLATTVSSYITNDGSIGQQLPYTPRYNFRANVVVGFKNLEIGYNQTYTGYRFITTDGTEYLSPYQTGNIRAAYKPLLYGKALQMNVQCNNIWGANYQVVAYRPMPGANWLAGLSLNVF